MTLVDWRDVPSEVVQPLLLAERRHALDTLHWDLSPSLKAVELARQRGDLAGFLLYDAKGRMLEQTEYIPVLAFALQPACEQVIRFFGDDIHPGDVILHNDVFSGGNQNNDVAVFKPIFHGNRLVAWAACKGHQADIGGAVRGGYNPEAREVWQEALRIPAVKIYERGTPPAPTASSCCVATS